MNPFMRKLYLVIGLAIVGVLAQTITAPIPVDWRYTFAWDDPNPAGQVASWTACASNNARMKVIPAIRSLSVDCSTLLSGVPAGTYALFVVPISALGGAGEASTNLYVTWPGGTGKLKGGGNLRTIR